MNPILSVRKLCKTYGSKTNKVDAVRYVSFDVEKGELLAIMGASGSGKSTLLNLLSTIDKYDSGSVVINNSQLDKLNKREKSRFRREELGFIFQDYNLLDTLTVYENIELGLRISEQKGNVDAMIRKIADNFDITELFEKYPYEISGGEKQRCACARAIVTNPSIVLADEPTGALDSKAAQIFLETLREINLNIGSTIIIVTHDPIVASYCNRVLYLKDGELVSEILAEENKKLTHKKILKYMNEISEECVISDLS